MSEMQYKFDIKRMLYFIIVVAAISGLFVGILITNRNRWDSVPFEKGPYLSWESATDSSMTIAWETTSKCDAIVEFGETTSLGSIVTNNTQTMLHAIRLTGLKPATRYYYRVSSSTPDILSDTLREVTSFRTGPASPADFKFVVFGDTQWDDMTQTSRLDWVTKRIVENEVTDSNPLAFALQTGDQFHYGDENLHDIQRWFSQIRPLGRQVPMMLARGNHDRKAGGEEYEKYVFMPNEGVNSELDYVFTYADSYFMVLDISRYKPGDISDERLAWVDARLTEAEAGAYQWVFVAFHVPPYASQFDFPYYQERLVPLLVGRVDAVFSGHLHYYEHLQVDGVHYFINGGGGGTLNGVHTLKNYNGSLTAAPISRQYHYLRVDVTAEKVTVTAISVESQVLETTNILKGEGVA